MLGATAKHPAMLFYLDNWLSVAPGYQPRAAGAGGAGKAERPQRELRPRGDGAAHAGRGRRLHAAGRHRAGAHPHRLDAGAAAAAAAPLRRRHGRRRRRGHGDSIFALRSGAPRQRHQDLAGPRRRARRPDGRRVRAGRAGAPSGHRAAHRLQAGAPLRRRRAVAGAGRPPGAALPRHRRRPARRDAGAASTAPEFRDPRPVEVQDAVPVRAVVGARHAASPPPTSSR